MDLAGASTTSSTTSAVSRPSPVVAQGGKRMWPDCSPPSDASSSSSLPARSDRRPARAACEMPERFNAASIPCWTWSWRRRISSSVGRGLSDLVRLCQHHGVAVDHVAMGTGKACTVRIAVEGEAQGRSARFHLGGDIAGDADAPQFTLILRPSGAMLSSVTSTVPTGERAGGNRLRRLHWRNRPRCAIRPG